MSPHNRNPAPRGEAVDRMIETALARLAARTVRAYRGDLENLRAFMRAATAAAAVGELITAGQSGADEWLTRWAGHLRQASSAATVNRRMACVCGLLRSARNRGMIDWTRRLVCLPVEPIRETRGPGRETVRAMLAHARTEGGPIGLRDAALLLTLYGMGLRRGEAAGMTVEGLDLKRHRATIVGKGRPSSQWVDMPRPTEDAVRSWLAVRGRADGPLWWTMSRARAWGDPLTDRGVYAAVRRLGAAVGAAVTPHGLRHTAITEAIEAGYALPDVQKFSRHRSLAPLLIYHDAAERVAMDIGDHVAGGL